MNLSKYFLSDRSYMHAAINIFQKLKQTHSNNTSALELVGHYIGY